MTMKTNGDMPAMPVTDDTGMPFNSVPAELSTIGLTKREMMAMHIASGLISDPQVRTGEVAATAVKVADALLAALERSKTAATQQCLRVLEGWQLVPVEATREMIDAAILVEEDGYAAMHSAMLAAAPKLGDE